MLTKEQEKELSEERIRLLNARYGKANPEVAAWIKKYGSVPKFPEVITANKGSVSVSESVPKKEKVKEKIE